MRIDEALQKLDAIHLVADRVATYQGLRAAPVAITGLMGISAALLQFSVVGSASDPLLAFLTLWVGVAAVALTLIVADMLLRYHRDPTARARRMTLEVLGRIASAAGLDAEAFTASLADPQREVEVTERIQQVTARGVTGVPCFIFNGRYAVSGAQPVEAFADLIRRLTT